MLVKTSTDEFPALTSTSTSAPKDATASQPLTENDVDAAHPIPLATSLGKRAREDDNENVALRPADDGNTPKPSGKQKKKRKHKDREGQSTT
jgi:hypothetical protein